MQQTLLLLLPGLKASARLLHMQNDCWHETIRCCTVNLFLEILPLAWKMHNIACTFHSSAGSGSHGTNTRCMLRRFAVLRQVGHFFCSLMEALRHAPQKTCLHLSTQITSWITDTLLERRVTCNQESFLHCKPMHSVNWLLGTMTT